MHVCVSAHNHTEPGPAHFHRRPYQRRCLGKLHRRRCPVHGVALSRQVGVVFTTDRSRELQNRNSTATKLHKRPSTGFVEIED